MNLLIIFEVAGDRRGTIRELKRVEKRFSEPKVPPIERIRCHWRRPPGHERINEKALVYDRRLLFSELESVADPDVAAR